MLKIASQTPLPELRLWGVSERQFLTQNGDFLKEFVWDHQTFFNRDETTLGCQKNDLSTRSQNFSEENGGGGGLWELGTGNFEIYPFIQQ